MGHGHESRIRELERRYETMGDDLRTLRRQTTAVREGVRDYWIDGIGRGSTATVPCLTRLKGQISGCLSSGATILPNSTLQVRGTQTLTDYGTYTLPGGDFDFNIDVEPGGDTSFDFAIGSSGSRWAAPSLAGPVSVGFTRCGTVNTGGRATPASGYACAGGLCNFPLATTLSFTDSRFGSGSLTFASGTWSGSGGGSSYGLGASSGILSVTHTGSPLLNRTALTCPDAGTTKFDATWTVSSGGGYTPGDTIRIFEP